MRRVFVRVFVLIVLAGVALALAPARGSAQKRQTKASKVAAESGRPNSDSTVTLKPTAKKRAKPTTPSAAKRDSQSVAKLAPDDDAKRRAKASKAAAEASRRDQDRIRRMIEAGKKKR